MRNSIVAAVLLLFLSFANSTIENEFSSQQGFYNQGTTIKTLDVRSDIECAFQCLLDEQCLGVNYHPGTNQGKDQCDFISSNNAVEEKEGWNFIEKVLPDNVVTSTASTVATSTAFNLVTSTAFTVLEHATTTYEGYAFIALRLQLPADGQSVSENWCKEYQNVCQHFGGRPTGCGVPYANNPSSTYNMCVTQYASDGSITNAGGTAGVLGCNPSSRVASVCNQVFGGTEARSGVNAFGFHTCAVSQCTKSFAGSYSALYKASSPTNGIVFTLCRPG